MTAKKKVFKNPPKSLSDYPELSGYADLAKRENRDRQHLVDLKEQWGFAQIDFDDRELYTTGECEVLFLRVDQDSNFKTVYQAGERYAMPRREISSDWCPTPEKAVAQLCKKLEAERLEYEKTLKLGTVRKKSK